MDCNPPGSSVHGISQQKILEWVTISFSRGSSWTHVSWIGRWILYHWATREGSPDCLLSHTEVREFKFLSDRLWGNTGSPSISRSPGTLSLVDMHWSCPHHYSQSLWLWPPALAIHTHFYPVIFPQTKVIVWADFTEGLGQWGQL